MNENAPVRRRWTHGEDNRLRALWLNDSLVQIASKLDRSVEAIKQRARAVGLNRSRLHRADGIRKDQAGTWLKAFVIRVGGIGTFARLLGCSRMTLQLLMRTTGRIPRDKIMQKLAEVSGESIELVKSHFGARTDARTTAIIAVVRKRFPHDRARQAVVNRIEKEQWTIRRYAHATEMNDESLRRWLHGERRCLQESSLRAIAKHEGLSRSAAGIPQYTAKKSRQRILARARRKLLRRKHRHRSEHMRQALSKSVKARWADPAWRLKEGDRIVGAWLDGWRRMRANEQAYVAHIVRREVGHFTKYHRSASPADVLRVLCRVWHYHRLQFPTSSLTFEVLPNIIQTELDVPLSTAIRAKGRPLYLPRIANMLRLLCASLRPEPFWPGAARRLYGDADMAEVARAWWKGVRAHVPFDLLHRLAETAVGAPVDAAKFRDVLRIPPGRPHKARLEAR